MHNVTKSTSTVNLGVGLARAGKKVLLVDCDAQGNLTQILGWPQVDELTPSLATLMEKVIQDAPIAPGEGALHHAEGASVCACFPDPVNQTVRRLTGL